MRIISEPTVARTDEAWDGSSRIKGLTRLLGGILFFALFHNPVQAEISVTLAWDPSPDATVVGYNMYYGVASRSYTNLVDVVNATNLTISGLVEATTYYFAVTAYNALGMESDYSNEISYTVPSSYTAPFGVGIRVTPARQVVLTVTGQIGRTYDILATQTFTAWTVIGTVTLGASGSWEFTDTNAVTSTARYYRTREKP